MGLFGSNDKPGSYVLTPTGKHEAETMSESGPRYAVLDALLDHSGAAPVRVLVDESQLDRETVERTLKQLEREGFVQQTGRK